MSEQREHGGHDGTYRCNCGAEWLAPDTEEDG
jgi:hypothetical protein